jgi:hypothetical protein
LDKGQYLSLIPPSFFANEEKIAVFKETPGPDRKGVRLIITRRQFFQRPGDSRVVNPAWGITKDRPFSFLPMLPSRNPRVKKLEINLSLKIPPSPLPASNQGSKSPKTSSFSYRMIFF